MYTKLANSILTSTVWMESHETRIVWLTLLAMADKNGEVQASIPGLANVARVDIGDCETAIELFLSPDPYSRTKEDEGRRIEEIDGGWLLLNHEKYRGLASDSEQKQKAAERQRRWRERQKRNGKSVTGALRGVTNNKTSRQNSHTDTDTDTDTDADAKAKAIPKNPVAQSTDVDEQHDKPEDVFDYWLASAATTKPRQLTKERRRKLTIRLKEDGWPWKAAIEKLPIANTPKFDWQPTFDWLIENGTNAVKLAEGQYDRTGGDGAVGTKTNKLRI